MGRWEGGTVVRLRDTPRHEVLGSGVFLGSNADWLPAAGVDGGSASWRDIPVLRLVAIGLAN